MSRSKGLREGSETNQSPRNAPCSRVADICDSLRRTQHSAERYVLPRRVGPNDPYSPRAMTERPDHVRELAGACGTIGARPRDVLVVDGKGGDQEEAVDVAVPPVR
jgi:hypothetical protein